MILDSKVNLLCESVYSSLVELEDCKTVVIAYSGGIDSHALMKACHQVKSELPEFCFKAVYIDHGLHKNSDQWRTHCEAVANDLSIPFQSIRVNAEDIYGDGPEQAARNARYTALKPLVDKESVLLTAQHEDDQAETLLLQLLRGSGVDGLAAMPKVASFSVGFIIRPFLNISQEVIRTYAVENKLDWVEDPSNDDLSINRNYLRKEVIPIIKSRWPAFSKTTSRTAHYCGEASELINLHAQNYIDQEHLKVLNMSDISRLESPEQRVILRQWLHLNEIKMPTSKILQELQQNVIAADISKSPVLQWGGQQIRRFGNNLYLLCDLPAYPDEFSTRWHGDECLLPEGLGKLQVTTSHKKGLSYEKWVASDIHVSFRKGGEKIKLPDRIGSKTIKNLFNEERVPPWVRGRIPIVYINNQLAAIADRWIDEAFLTKEGELSYQIHWSEFTFSR